jgi:beta-mannosidase
VQLTLHVSAEVLQATPLAVNVVVRLNGETFAQSQADLQTEGNTTLQLILARPRLWWVNGLGEQPLYDVSVELLDPAHATLLDTLAKRIGLRVLQL